MSRCEFIRAWVGQCKNDLPCEEHDDLKCVSCGEPAICTCDETGQFVCGAPLCGDCEHTLFEDGTNGGIGFNASPCPEGMKRHIRKGTQRHTPWYTRDLKEEG